MLQEFECDEVEAGEGIEALMKGFALKASISEMISLGEGGEKAVGVKVFLVEDCREEGRSRISRWFWRDSTGETLDWCKNTEGKE